MKADHPDLFVRKTHHEGQHNCTCQNEQYP
jgi:hypothetical protein